HRRKSFGTGPYDRNRPLHPGCWEFQSESAGCRREERARSGKEAAPKLSSIARIACRHPSAEAGLLEGCRRDARLPQGVSGRTTGQRDGEEAGPDRETIGKRNEQIRAVAGAATGGSSRGERRIRTTAGGTGFGRRARCRGHSLAKR